MPAPVLINYAAPAPGLFLAMSQFSIVSFRGEGIEVKHASEGGNCGSLLVGTVLVETTSLRIKSV